MPGKIAIIGCGAIGSHLVPLIVRQACVRELILVDPDRYEPRNLRHQAMAAADVGKDKVLIQARRAREANPLIRVSVFPRRVQDIPWGVLRDADLLLSCLDSRLARVAVNAITRRLRLPWLDSGCLGQACILPLWDREAGAPWIRGFRVAIFRPGKRAVSSDFTTAFLLRLARQAGAQLVKKGLLEEGGDPSITVRDIRAAVWDFFARARDVLAPHNCRNYIEDLPQDVDVVRVEPLRRLVSNPDRFLNAVA